MRKSVNVRKLAIAGMLVAFTVALSGFSVPIGASKCFPIQHLINIVAGILLGPGYGVGMAFCSSLIRNLLGTGSLLAFPGSMVGAFLCAFLYKQTKRLSFAYAGELFGTAVLGGLLCYPIASFVMGKEAALFTYIFPFFVSSAGGTLCAIFFIGILSKSGLLAMCKNVMEGTVQ